ncbi:assimilatory sulfite reductase (NADPH) flavoprotein subunit [Shewanella yunxiaonensis]|uniref:Sulfite reductase [NADPH] flavoprotein alpha-component n=1 Tax=Shewanella yunxiaonensis TaxID=2829809 RepID=A0ABX7YWG5_9GAMM|nr:assimilatory sulfite reductase (NADPH) flavoprotein subunit [Shewanella yunxiaonensis]QUN06501.1 assimilatory sulfite reductase (NADPH) flavoprotein subunit [Shewanella yunxiaonensis]
MSLKELSSLVSPLTESQVTQLQQLAAQLSPLQQAWVSGYLAASAGVAAQTTAQVQPGNTLTILYGSQTGNSRGIASQLAQQARANGYAVNLSAMGEYNVRSLKQEQLLVVIVSTQGEGDAPDDAIELHKFLASKRAPKLEQLHYAVLALGDSSYEFFCQTGKDFDERLAALGAKPLLPRVDCDVDYQQLSEQWQQQLLVAVQPHLQTSAQVVSIDSVKPANTASGYSKQQPYEADILLSQKITGRDSTKDTRHIEIDLGESGIQYQPGDALGVYFSNYAALVDELLSSLQLDGDSAVMLQDRALSLRQALLDEKELTQLYPGLVQFWAQHCGSDELQAIADDREQSRLFIRHHQLADLQRLYPITNVDAQQLIDVLRPITPRLYSIASSQSEVDTEVHLTVGLVQEVRDGIPRYGAASGFLARAEEGQKLRVYVEANKHFRLPTDPATPVIMIGPGTGVAPFRAFMQQRAAQGASGDSWLFFGNPHFEQDFLYQTEWQQYLKTGQLSRISLAFSRDQQQKIYVQQRIREQGEALWQWLQRGAHLYLCGDAERMAKDVQQALVDVVVAYGGLDAEAATEYLENLRQQGRFQKDVY